MENKIKSAKELSEMADILTGGHRKAEVAIHVLISIADSLEIIATKLEEISDKQS